MKLYYQQITIWISAQRKNYSIITTEHEFCLQQLLDCWNHLFCFSTQTCSINVSGCLEKLPNLEPSSYPRRSDISKYLFSFFIILSPIQVILLLIYLEISILDLSISFNFYIHGLLRVGIFLGYPSRYLAIRRIHPLHNVLPPLSRDRPRLGSNRTICVDLKLRRRHYSPASFSSKCSRPLL